MKHKTLLSLFIILSSALSVVFFVILFSSVRCEPDEMVAGLNFRNYSILDIYKNNYWYDTFRPMYPLFAYFGVGITNNSQYYPLTFLLIYLFITTLFVFTIYKLLLQVFTFQQLSYFEKLILVCFSILFLMGLYFITTNRLEIFGWLSASITHLIPIVFVFISAYFLMKEHKKTDLIILLICVFFIGGAAEHVAPSVLAIIGACSFLFFYGKKNKKTVLKANKPLFLKLTFFSALLLLFFLFTVITPGSWHRYYNTQQYVKIHSPERSLETLHTLTLLFSPYKIGALLYLFFLWLIFTTIFQVRLKTGIQLKYLIVSLIAVTFTTGAFCFFAYKTFNVDRMWFVFDATIFILACCITLRFTERLKDNIVFTSLGLIYLLGIITLFDVRHIPALYRFSKGHDKIITFLQQQKEGALVEIESFPPPDLTTQTGITADPENHFNVLFCKFYHVRAKVSVKHPYN